jgi:hypothetical protein
LYLIHLTACSDFHPFIWSATNAGAAKYNSTNWTVLDTGNSCLPDNNVLDIAVRNVVIGITLHPFIWFTTNAAGDGVAVWDQSSAWTIYGRSKTGACAMDRASRLAVDNNNDVWMTAFQINPNLAEPHDSAAPQIVHAQGICRFSNGTFTLYDSVVQGLPSDWGNDLSVDSAGRV